MAGITLYAASARALVVLTPGSIGLRYFQELAEAINVPGEPDLAKVKASCCGTGSCLPKVKSHAWKRAMRCPTSNQKRLYMQGLGRAFFASALVYGVLGMLLGLDMAIRKNHGQMPTHAHIMVIGWLSFALFGIFYSLHESAVPRLLARLHFWLAQISLAGLVVGLWLLYAGRTQFEPVAAVSSLAYAASFLVFVVVAIPAMRARSE